MNAIAMYIWNDYQEFPPYLRYLLRYFFIEEWVKYGIESQLNGCVSECSIRRKLNKTVKYVYLLEVESDNWGKLYEISI